MSMKNPFTDFFAEQFTTMQGSWWPPPHVENCYAHRPFARLAPPSPAAPQEKAGWLFQLVSPTSSVV
jgi:hypothetical protein